MVGFKGSVVRMSDITYKELDFFYYQLSLDWCILYAGLGGWLHVFGMLPSMSILFIFHHQCLNSTITRRSGYRKTLRR